MVQEIRVRFSPSAGDRFRVQFTDAAGNALGMDGDFTPFLAEDDYENLRWYLEDYMDLPDGGAVTRATGIEQQLHQWGRRLHEALFGAPENHALLRQLLDSPEPRELTIATDQSALLRLPWELLADGAGSLAQRVSIRRQLDTPESLLPRAVQLPLRILYVVSRPGDTGFIDPRMTTKSLLAALDPLGASVRIDFCRPPTLARMEEMLRDAQASGEPYHLVHSTATAPSCPRRRSARCASRSLTAAPANRRPTTSGPIGWARCWRNTKSRWSCWKPAAALRWGRPPCSGRSRLG